MVYISEKIIVSDGQQIGHDSILNMKEGLVEFEESFQVLTLKSQAKLKLALKEYNVNFTGLKSRLFLKGFDIYLPVDKTEDFIEYVENEIIGESLETKPVIDRFMKWLDK
jgi:hypothetical protein